MSNKKFNSLNDFHLYNPDINNASIKIFVGMGSCGIAAGANKVFDTLKEEIEEHNLKNIELRKVGCLGLCFSEPNVEVKLSGLPDVLYGKVDKNFSVRIIEEHIIGNKIINENIIDKPFIDVYEF